MPSEPVPALVGLGMSVLDLVQVVADFPCEGGVTKVQRSVLMGGGPVPTALCAAARLGTRSAIIDRVGDDWRGLRLREDYARFGVATDFLTHEEGRRSTFGTVLSRESDGERHLLYDEGDVTPLSEGELPGSLLEQCRILHLNGRHWPACVAAAKKVRRAGGLVSFDGGAHRYDAKFLALFPHVDFLIVAAEFADRTVGEGSREDQLDRLAAWGAGLVGITEGVRGSWFLGKGGERFHQAAFPVSPLVDTTGCGDVFHGAFLSFHLAGRSWQDSARCAAAAAALAATELGGRGRLVSSGEIEAFLRERESDLSVAGEGKGV